MGSKYKNTEEMLRAIITTLNVGAEALADKKIDLNDIGLVLKLIPVFGPAVDDASLIPGELENLDAMDGAALVTMVMNELQVGDDHAKEIINESLKTVAQVLNLLRVIRKK